MENVLCLMAEMEGVLLRRRVHPLDQSLKEIKSEVRPAKRRRRSSHITLFSLLPLSADGVAAKLHIQGNAN